MRVTFISHYAELYGANRSLLNLIDGLRAYGVQPSVICHSPGPITLELTKRGIPYLVFPFAHWLNLPQSRHLLNGLVRILVNVKNLPALKKQVAQWQPDIIYTNSSVTPIGALLAIALGKPHVWHIREFGIEDFGLRHDIGKGFFRFFLNRAAGIIAISRSIQDRVLRDVRNRIHVIYNGVITANELEKMAAHHSSPKKQAGSFTFAIAGLIHPSKGQQEAIEALALIHRKYPKVELLIAGNGTDEYVQELKVLVQDLDVAPYVNFLGFVNDIYTVYNQADAVLMCSRYEAMGRVTAEAMAAGKPVIGYNSAGTAEIIANGRTGLLYEGNQENLALCMENLIENPELVHGLVKNAREKVREEFTVEACSVKVFNLLNSILTEKRGKSEYR